MASPAPATAKPIALLRLPGPVPRGGGGGFRSARLTLSSAAARFRVAASASDVPDFLSSDWSHMTVKSEKHAMDWFSGSNEAERDAVNRKRRRTSLGKWIQVGMASPGYGAGLVHRLSLHFRIGHATIPLA